MPSNRLKEMFLERRAQEKFPQLQMLTFTISIMLSYMDGIFGVMGVYNSYYAVLEVYMVCHNQRSSPRLHCSKPLTSHPPSSSLGFIKLPVRRRRFDETVSLHVMHRSAILHTRDLPSSQPAKV
jgi:hypothetical protein